MRLTLFYLEQRGSAVPGGGGRPHARNASVSGEMLLRFKLIIRECLLKAREP